MIRLILLLLLFFIIYNVVKLIIKFGKSPSNATLHNSKQSRNKNKYENIQDAEFTEIKSEEEKKNKS